MPRFFTPDSASVRLSSSCTHVMHTHMHAFASAPLLLVHTTLDCPKSTHSPPAASLPREHAARLGARLGVTRHAARGSRGSLGAWQARYHVRASPGQGKVWCTGAGTRTETGSPRTEIASRRSTRTKNCLTSLTSLPLPSTLPSQPPYPHPRSLSLSFKTPNHSCTKRQHDTNSEGRERDGKADALGLDALAVFKSRQFLELKCHVRGGQGGGKEGGKGGGKGTGQLWAQAKKARRTGKVSASVSTSHQKKASPLMERPF